MVGRRFVLERKVASTGKPQLEAFASVEKERPVSSPLDD